MDWLWMHNPETGGTARFNPATEAAWLARGWQRCDAPEEGEDPRLRDPVVKPAGRVEDSDVGAEGAEDQGPRTRRAARRGGETQED